MNQEFEDDSGSEIVLKRPEHSTSLYKKEVPKKKQSRMRKTTAVDIGKDVTSMLNSGEIPSAAAIHAARKKREMARHINSDTIKLTENNSNTPDMSDDENSGDELVGSRTVRHFGISQDSSKQMKVLSAMDEAASGSDEDKFVEDQICKGVYTFPLTSVKSHDIISFDNNRALTSVPISVETLQSQLSTQLEVLREQRASNKSMLNKLKEDRNTAGVEIDTMEELSKALSIRYQFFQEIQSYVKDLLLCVTEKVWYSRSLKVVEVELGRVL